jgi:hypothetical protein
MVARVAGGLSCHVMVCHTCDMTTKTRTGIRYGLTAGVFTAGMAALVIDTTEAMWGYTITVVISAILFGLTFLKGSQS